MNIVVRRSGALGDVVLTTPIIRRLRRENPAAAIHVVTGFPDVFRNNPHLSAVADKLDAGPYQLIDLDLVYERQPILHIVEAYMQHAFGDLGNNPADLQQELFHPKPSFFSRDRKYVAVHPTVAGWSNRTLPRATWLAVIAGLRKAGLWSILVGSSRDALPGADVTCFTSTDILAHARLIAGCAAFVGSDSGLLHVAGATSVPIVGVFTCARPETRLPWRNGVQGGGCTAIMPNLGCIGCLERRPPPVTDEHCERGDIACVAMVEAGAIVDAVVAAVEAR